MADTNRRLYEAMFLIGQSEAADLAGVITQIEEIFQRASAEIVAMRKWDERRLAYPVRKQKRGLYILAYFRAPSGNIRQLERDCVLAEKILRVLVIRADHLTDDEARAADARDALVSEARMRADRVQTREDEGGAAVTVGAPTRDQPAEAEEAAGSEV